MQRRKIRNGILLSLIAILILSVGTLIGRTFAFFTGSTEKDVHVSSGVLNVTVLGDDSTSKYYKRMPDGTYIRESNSAPYIDADIVYLDVMSRGYAFEFDVNLTNASDIDIKWRPVFRLENASEEENKKLLSELKIKIKKEGIDYLSAIPDKDGSLHGWWESLTPEETSAKFTVWIELPNSSTLDNVGSSGRIKIQAEAIQANALEKGESLAYERSGNGYVVSGIGTLKDQSEVNIYDWHQDYDETPLPVVGIKSSAFSGNDNIKTVHIAEASNENNGIKSIGSYAFQGCLSLTSVNIPESLEKIEDLAFDDCISFRGDIVLPEGFTTLGWQAFRNTKIQSFDISKTGWSRIPNKAFSGCGSLTTVKISSNITAIGGDAFYGCLSFTHFEGYGDGTELVLPSSVENIGSYAFKSTRITKINFGSNSNLTISDHAFSNCNYLNGLVLPASLGSIADDAFKGSGGSAEQCGEATIPGLAYKAVCQLSSISKITFLTDIPDLEWEGSHPPLVGSLQSISFDSNVTRIGNYTFSGFYKLETIEAFGGVGTIGQGAFQGTGITSINMPDNVSLGAAAFAGCLGLVINWGSNYKGTQVGDAFRAGDGFVDTRIQKMTFNDSLESVMQNWAEYFNNINYYFPHRGILWVEGENGETLTFDP